MTYEKELAVGLDAARRASLLCREIRKTVDVAAIEKADRSPVTMADFAGQAVINQLLGAAFPADPIVAEEDSEALRQNADLRGKVAEYVRRALGGAETMDVLAALDRGDGGIDLPSRYWTVDPIDGTKGFLRGGQYAVALALVENGAPVVGILGCPGYRLEDAPEPEDAGGFLFHAVAGRGAFMRPLDGGADSPISVDAIADPRHARFCESVEKAHAAHDVHARISDAMGIQAFPCRMDSQAKYAAVARGDASIYLRLPRSAEYRERVWDHAAGAIIVTEAGGAVTDFSGKPLDFSKGGRLVDNYGIVASNGLLHPRLLSVIADTAGSCLPNAPAPRPCG